MGRDSMLVSALGKTYQRRGSDWLIDGLPCPSLSSPFLFFLPALAPALFGVLFAPPFAFLVAG